jgi:probable rRNA maturation factor
MDKVKVMITNNQTEIKIPVGIRMLVRRCCHAVLEYEDFGKDAEVSVSFINDKQIHELNKEHRNIDRPTDVLSFPLGEDGEYDVNYETGACLLGDIVISLETATRQAQVYGHSLEREVGFLTVHSMLHLMGYDHVDGGVEAVRMREKEENVLTNLGLKRNGSYYFDEE